MSIEIRKLQYTESAIYREIRLACLKNTPELFVSTYEEEVLNSKLKFEAYIEDNAPEHFMFGAFDGKTLIGIAGFDRKDRNRARHRGELVQVYVDAGYRGQHLGEKLIRQVLEDAFALEGIEQIQLSAVSANQGAIKLYEKIGFHTYGIQPRFSKVGDMYMDQTLMQLLKEDYQG